MTPEAQRIAIAEACGWRCTASFKEVFFCWVRPDGMDHQTEWLPDYLNDLNAMHEAEKVLTGVQKSIYISRLGDGIIRIGNVFVGGFDYLHATAAQRAEAFLRTLGKWEDDK